MLQMSRYVCVCLLAVFILHVIFPALKKKKKKKDSSPEKGYPGQMEYSMKLDFFEVHSIPNGLLGVTKVPTCYICNFYSFPTTKLKQMCV